MINYYKIQITGKNVYHIFNKIIQNKINVFDVFYDNSKIVLKVGYFDYLKIKKLNTIYEITILDIKGYKKYHSLIKFYKKFLFLFLINLILIFLYSKMIFKININTNNDNLKNIIKEELINNKITIFSFAKPFSKLQQIKENIKNNHEDLIEWLEISKDGVSYNIDVIERKKDLKNNDDVKHDIVACKNGLIMDTYIESGEILKNKGDYVSINEVIVSSKITKNENIKNIVDAKGKVYAETWYKVSLTSSLKKDIKKIIYQENKFIIKIFNKELVLFKLKNKTIKQEKNTYLFKSNIFSFIVKKQNVYKKDTKNYSENELALILEEMAKETITKKIAENEKILLQKTLKKTINNGKMNIEVFFKVYENIACESISSPIEMTEQE